MKVIFFLIIWGKNEKFTTPGKQSEIQNYSKLVCLLILKSQPTCKGISVAALENSFQISFGKKKNS